MIEVFVMNSDIAGAKNPIKLNGWNHHAKDKREGPKKAKRHSAHMN
jgi:hypothetical protein